MGKYLIPVITSIFLAGCNENNIDTKTEGEAGIGQSRQQRIV